MIHELKNIFEKAYNSFLRKEKCVLASVVALDGTSYRKPGVRMLITQSGKMVGAVSGGCVEKDIAQRAQNVFKTNEPIVMAYDGRYRLGCQGTLYILIEPFKVDDKNYKAFQVHLEKREPVVLASFFKKEDNATGAFGTQIILEDKTYNYNCVQALNLELETFNTTLKPCFKLLIIGAEHDAVKLCTLASNMGWEVIVVSTWRDPKTKLDFTGAKDVWSLSPEMLDVGKIDNETAVVLMTHNYALDLKYLSILQQAQFAYLGVLGARNRNEQLKAELLEYSQELTEFNFYGPIGLDIGAETPEEIAIAIIAEILAHIRGKKQQSLSSYYNIQELG